MAIMIEFLYHNYGEVTMKNIIKKLSHSKLEPLFYLAYNILIKIEYLSFSSQWYIKGYRKPDQEAINNVANNVTFIYKSFERQKLAKRLYKNIASYYPGAKVIIADDSHNPLKIKGDNLEIIQLPFNSGLSYGLNRALEKVTTAYTVRLDDDELLTPLTRIEDELAFLNQHREVDLVGFGIMSTPKCQLPKKSLQFYFSESMSRAPKKLIIPHLTMIDQNHIVVGKSPNSFIVRTNKLKELGWDDNIRMMDHKEFFIRAAGNIVSTVNPNTIIFHGHNQFNKNYQNYRSRVAQDKLYIQNKYAKRYQNNK